MPIESINPATGQTNQKFTELPPVEIEARVLAAGKTFADWRRASFSQRAAVLNATAQQLRAAAENCAVLMAREMGKPLAQGRAEVEKCAWVCEYYAQEAERFLAPEIIRTDATRSFVTFQPLGVILAVMPWNFPFWQVFRAAVPALMAGNAVLLKHASNVPLCALVIEELFNKAGLPSGLFRTLLIGSERAAELIAHPLIRGVTVTGSVEAGRSIAARAGALLKKTVLELGGNDPYLILEDAPLAQAAEACAAARLINAGQSCIAAKRFIVVESVRRQFEGLLANRMASRRMGDPMDPGVHLGPLARLDLRDGLHQQVRQSLDLGARLLLGGTLPEGPGAFYPPTVLTEVRKGMAVCDEETFGPVAAIIAVRDEAEAVRVANDSPFGLGAAVFTGDIARGERIAATELEAGCCFVNDFVRSDPRLPFGGIKDSGYGRELAAFGIREFVNVKTVYAK